MARPRIVLAGAGTGRRGPEGPVGPAGAGADVTAAEIQAAKVAAEQAAADAEAAKVAVEAVEATNDGIMASVAGDPESAFANTLSAAIAAQAAPVQSDFARLALDQGPRYTTMRLAKVGTSTYSVRLNDGERGAIYRFIKDTNDDFIKIDSCYTGYGLGLVGLDSPEPGDLTGTWNTASATYYTQVAASTATMTVPGGSTLQLRINKTDRGGLWSVAVDGGAPVTVSCWGATGTTEELVTVATGLDPDVSHTVVCTYAGDDPAHAPSTSPSRAYLRKNDSAGTLIGSVPDAATTKMVLADGSNKEFAFTPNIGGQFNWLPEHDAVGSCFKVTDPEWLVDGSPVDVGAMSIGDYAEGETIELRQHFKGKIIASNTEVLEFWTSHRVTKADGLRFTGRCTALTSLDSLVGYCMMLPSWNATANTFMTALGNSQVNSTDEQYHYFGNERDACFSGAIISAANPEVIGAGTLEEPRLTYRRGKVGKPPEGESLFVWHRAAKPKMYWQPFSTWAMPVGSTYTWGFQLAVADIPGIYSTLTAA